MENASNKVNAKRIGVVAKYDWYLSDAENIFRNSGHELMTFNNLAALKDEIEKNSNFDYLFFPHFSEILPVELYSIYNCIGFHTGDLPRDRGGSPIQNKILLGEYITKVSAFRIEGGIDSGPIYIQKIIDLSEGNLEEILLCLSKICAGMMLEILEKLPNPVAQNGKFEARLRRKAAESLLPTDCNNLRSLYDFIRMLDGLDYPRAYLNLGEFKIEFTSAIFAGDEISTKCVIKRKK